MKIRILFIAAALLASASAHAIDSKYREKLERSGCTQVSEAQGCDINKTKAENAKAGFGTSPAAATSKFAGTWLASNGETKQLVSTIHVDAQNKVTVNGKPVAAKISNGALVFKVGFISYNILGDPKLPNENTWYDSDAQNSGPIRRK